MQKNPFICEYSIVMYEAWMQGRRQSVVQFEVINVAYSVEADTRQ